MLKRLRIHGLIKKVGHTYHYYVTRLGKIVATAGLRIKELVLIPQLVAGLPEPRRFLAASTRIS
jgi:hypothetical protein